MEPALKQQCLGGWGFLLLALGLFILLPASILMGLYAGASGAPEQAAAVGLFAVALALLLVGLGLGVWWCRVAGQSKDPDAEQPAAPAGTSNGKSAADEANGAAAAASKYQSNPDDPDDASQLAEKDQKITDCPLPPLNPKPIVA